MSKIDALLFDCEGVVVDSETVWDHGQEVFLSRRGFVYDRERTKPHLTGRTLAEGVRVMQQQYGFGGDPDELARERLGIVKDLFAHEVEFIPGFREFYEQVRYTYKTCIATALSDELLALVDERLGLAELFSGQLFTLSHVGFRSKPNPDLFLHAAQKLGSKPEDCIVLEDAPHGIEAARRARMLSIGIATTYRPDQLAGADLVIRSYAELDPATLDSLAPSAHTAAAAQRHESDLLAIDGVEGVRASGGSVVVYLRNEEARNRLPLQIEGLPVRAVVTGELVANAP